MGERWISSSLLLCVNVLYSDMLSLVFFFRYDHWKIRYKSHPDLLPLLFFIIPYFILIRFYSFFCRPASVQPLKLYYVILRKVAVKYIYHAVRLTNFNFWHPKSNQLTLIDMIVSFIVFLTIVNFVHWLRWLDTIDNKQFYCYFQNPFRFPFVFKFVNPTEVKII